MTNRHQVISALFGIHGPAFRHGP